MIVAKRIKSAYILNGEKAVPVSENLFQFKMKSKYKVVQLPKKTKKLKKKAS